MASLRHLNGKNSKDALVSIVREYRAAWTLAVVSPFIDDIDSMNGLHVWLEGPKLSPERETFVPSKVSKASDSAPSSSEQYLDHSKRARFSPPEPIRSSSSRSTQQTLRTSQDRSHNGLFSQHASHSSQQTFQTSQDRSHNGSSSQRGHTASAPRNQRHYSDHDGFLPNANTDFHRGNFPAQYRHAHHARDQRRPSYGQPGYQHG